MLKALVVKLKEAAVSVLPVALIVLLLNCTPLVNFTGKETIAFSISALALIIGISLFNLGADIAMTPIGEQIGSTLPKSGKFKTLLLIGFLMGVFITIAEPDLSVLATQVSAVMNPTALILFVGVGVGAFLLLAVLKILTKTPLSNMLYSTTFALPRPSRASFSCAVCSKQASLTSGNSEEYQLFSVVPSKPSKALCISAKEGIEPLSTAGMGMDIHQTGTHIKSLCIDDLAALGNRCVSHFTETGDDAVLHKDNRIGNQVVTHDQFRIDNRYHFSISSPGTG